MTHPDKSYLGFRKTDAMKTTPLLIGLLLAAGCQQTTTVEQAQPGPETIQEQTEKTEVPEEFPPISIYAGKEYSPDLQQELDARNAKREVHTEIMTLVDAGRGEDTGFIEFRDAKGKSHAFDGFPYDEQMKFTETETGEVLSDPEKGKKYKVTWSIKAYWLDAAAEVLEADVVREMVKLP